MDNNLNTSVYCNDVSNQISSSKTNYCNRSCIYFPPCSLPNPSIYKPSIEYVVDVPINLAKSLEGQPETTIVDDEQGKFIFPPGGSFFIFLPNPESPELSTNGRIAFGWWEEPICNK